MSITQTVARLARDVAAITRGQQRRHDDAVNLVAALEVAAANSCVTRAEDCAKAAHVAWQMREMEHARGMWICARSWHLRAADHFDRGAAQPWADEQRHLADYATRMANIRVSTDIPHGAA